MIGSGDNDWIMYSDSFFQGNNGRVVIRNNQMSGVEFVIDGTYNGNFVGEHMWVSGDGQSGSSQEGAGRRLQSADGTEEANDVEGTEEGPISEEGSQTENDEEAEEPVAEEEPESFDSNFSHVIVGVSAKSTQDELDHISFYKLIQQADGSFELFDFGIDVIQTEISPSRHTADELRDNRGASGPTLYNGSFMWTSRVDSDNGSTYVTNQLSICNSRQFFNTETAACEACAENMGTTGFQQTSCKSCGDIWFDSQDDPSSMEAIIARQLCEDPEQVYEDERAAEEEEPSIVAEILDNTSSSNDEEEVGLLDTKIAGLNIFVWIIIIVAVIAILLIVIVLVTRRNPKEKNQSEKKEKGAYISDQ